MLALFFLACTPGEVPVSEVSGKGPSAPAATSIVVLGTIQDGGSPHIGCTKDCCRSLFKQPDVKRQVVALGLYGKAEGNFHPLQPYESGYRRA